MRKLYILFLLALCAAGAWVVWALDSSVMPPGPTFVLLRPGYSTRRIAHELRAAGVIRSTDAFLLLHYFKRARSLKAGEYLFERSDNAVRVHDRLVRGDIYVHTVVIPEGFTIFDIAQAMQNAGLGPREEFIKLATSETGLIADIAPGAPSLEGYLFPNTYEFTRTQSTAEMIAVMVKQFRQVAQQLRLVTDVPQTVIMASIIEKETGAAEERAQVASVYYNRLRENMPLQADPSIIYGELLAGSYTGVLHHDDMRFDSAYNTYMHPGLPPGPIGNPGRSSLEAALHPATTDYLYFVADGGGHHRFAQTLVEHNRNVAAYRRAKNGG